MIFSLLTLIKAEDDEADAMRFLNESLNCNGIVPEDENFLTLSPGSYCTDKCFVFGTNDKVSADIRFLTGYSDGHYKWQTDKTNYSKFSLVYGYSPLSQINCDQDQPCKIYYRPFDCGILLNPTNATMAKDLYLSYTSKSKSLSFDVSGDMTKGEYYRILTFIVGNATRKLSVTDSARAITISDASIDKEVASEITSDSIEEDIAITGNIGDENASKDFKGKVSYDVTILPEAAEDSSDPLAEILKAMPEFNGKVPGKGVFRINNDMSSISSLSEPEETPKKSKTGMIVGIVIAVLVVIAIICVLVWFFVFRKKTDSKNSSGSGTNA